MPDTQSAAPPPATAIETSAPVHAFPVEVPMLDASAWREYRGQPGKATANSTHIAVVADDAGIDLVSHRGIGAESGAIPGLLGSRNFQSGICRAGWLVNI